MAVDLSLSTKQERCYQVTATTPTQAGANNVGTVAVTCTGVKLGDVVLAAATTALPANQLLVNAVVTAADQVTLIFDSSGATTGASRTFNVQVYQKS